MWKRTMLTLGLAIMGLTALAPGVLAQEARLPYGGARLDPLAALFKRPAVPPRLARLDVPDTLAVGAEGRFSAVANVEVAALPLTVRWDFGDGHTARGLHVLHRYDAPGRYAVTFTLANPHGTVTERRLVVVVPVEARVPSLPPTQRSTVK